MQTILIVDDNSVNVALYQRVLGEMAQIRAVCQTDPNKALQWCQAETPDAVVVDYRMPETDGLAFIRRFRATAGCGDVPVVMLTSVNHPVLWQHALDAGANAYLTKPVDKLQFIGTIKKLLGRDKVAPSGAS